MGTLRVAREETDDSGDVSAVLSVDLLPSCFDHW